MPASIILVVSVLAVFLIGGPLAKALGTSSPSVGIGTGIATFLLLSILSAAFQNKK